MTNNDTSADHTQQSLRQIYREKSAFGKFKVLVEVVVIVLAVGVMDILLTAWEEAKPRNPPNQPDLEAELFWLKSAWRYIRNVR